MSYHIRSGMPVTNPQAELVRRLTGPDEAERLIRACDSASISVAIDRLIAQSRERRAAQASQPQAPPASQPQASQPQASQPQTASPGYYLDSQDRAYVVVMSQNNRPYAKQLMIRPGHNAKWEYDRGAVFRLAEFRPLTLAEAKRLGHLLGVCMICGRRLVDVKSVQEGIGPVCIKTLNGASDPLEQWLRVLEHRNKYPHNKLVAAGV